MSARYWVHLRRTLCSVCCAHLIGCHASWQALRSEEAELQGMAADAEAELGSAPQPEQAPRPGGRAAELAELRDMARAEAAELLARVRRPTCLQQRRTTQRADLCMCAREQPAGGRSGCWMVAALWSGSWGTLCSVGPACPAPNQISQGLAECMAWLLGWGFGPCYAVSRCCAHAPSWDSTRLTRACLGGDWPAAQRMADTLGLPGAQAQDLEAEVEEALLPVDVVDAREAVLEVRAPVKTGSMAQIHGMCDGMCEVEPQRDCRGCPALLAWMSAGACYALVGACRAVFSGRCWQPAGLLPVPPPAAEAPSGTRRCARARAVMRPRCSLTTSSVCTSASPRRSAGASRCVHAPAGGAAPWLVGVQGRRPCPIAECRALKPAVSWSGLAS